MKRSHRFGDGPLGDALDVLVEATEHCGKLETAGRVLLVCRMLEWNPGGDSVHEMVHDELDLVETEPCMKQAADRLRTQLLGRKHSAGALRRD